MALGPQLPPHLAKRKRDSDGPEADHDRDASPGPEKRARTIGPAMPPVAAEDRANPDELDLESSEEEEDEAAGPQAAPVPAPRPPAARPIGPIGPALPPPPPAADSRANPNEIGLDLSDDEDDDDDVGPPLPNSSIPVSAARPPPSTSAGPRSIGPAMPPPAADSDSDDDDDMGPALPPPSAGSSDSRAPVSVFDRPGASPAQPAGPTGPQRDEWMLAPPDGADWASKIDPTKLRSRKFASGPRSGGGARSSGGGGGGGGAGGAGMGAQWTETPEEKRRRLADAVMGVSGGGGGGNGGTEGREGGRGRERDADAIADDVASRRRRREDEETQRRISEYNERNRPESLAKRHARTRDADQDDDPSKRAFDREKDIGGGVRITNKQKREMMDRAANFGSRFAKGSYL